MARYTGPVCRLCRRESVKLFLKGERCYNKCPIDQKKTVIPPGQKKKRRPKFTEYSKRLREKQKTKRLSGLLERQFHRNFMIADRIPGQTGENLLRILETRLDNVVRRLGFSSSLAQGRQLVVHGHILVNGKRVNTPSYTVDAGDKVELVKDLRQNPNVQHALERASSRGLPGWLGWEPGLEATIRQMSPGHVVDLSNVSLVGFVRVAPSREEMSFPVNEQLIVELYSK